MTKVEETLDHMRHDAHCLHEEARKLRARAEEFELNACVLDGAVARISRATREDAEREKAEKEAMASLSGAWAAAEAAARRVKP